MISALTCDTDPNVGDVTKVVNSWDGTKAFDTSIEYSCSKGEVFTDWWNNTVTGSCKYKPGGQMKWDYDDTTPLKDCTGRKLFSL